jgi:hypothetical protein
VEGSKLGLPGAETTGAYPAAAIEKLKIAHQTGPHFANPLEIWGEVLFFAGKPNEANKRFGIAAGLDLSKAD